MAPVRKPSRASIASTSKDQTPKAPTKTISMITQRQKQALIDNLQLEITERARKLRAQYALQAQSLHTRIELRVNRIPTSLRNVTIGELLDKYATSAKRQAQKVAADKKPDTKPASTSTNKTQKPATTTTRAVRGVKRTSDHLEDDKENTPDPNQIVANPKKRVKPDGERRVPDPSTVLSPKSSNSRTVPQSPIRGHLGPQKNNAPSRPASPLKPASPVKPATTIAGEKPRATKPTANTGSTRSRPTSKPANTTAEVKPYTSRTKRGLAVAGDRAVSNVSSNTSGLSGTSTGTTIVKKVGRTLGTSGTTGAKKIAGKTTTGTIRKTTAAPAMKAAPTAASTTGRRTLRKRA